MTLNEKTVTLKLQRSDVGALLLACTVAAINYDAEKWNKLHDKISASLKEFDSKQGELK